MRAHHSQRHDRVARLERSRRRLGQERRVQHEVLAADDRRAALAEQPRDIRPGETAAENEHASAGIARFHRSLSSIPAMHRPPGTQKPRRFRPRFHWELLVCGVRGHELIGTDAAQLRPEDAVDRARRKRHPLVSLRPLRSWIPLPPPESPARETPPPRDEIELPLRGKALRDRVVLRIIAIDRAIHFVVLLALAVAVFLFAAHRCACATSSTASSTQSRAARQARRTRPAMDSCTRSSICSR